MKLRDRITSVLLSLSIAFTSCVGTGWMTKTDAVAASDPEYISLTLDTYCGTGYMGSQSVSTPNGTITVPAPHACVHGQTVHHWYHAATGIISTTEREEAAGPCDITLYRFDVINNTSANISYTVKGGRSSGGALYAPYNGLYVPQTYPLPWTITITSPTHAVTKVTTSTGVSEEYMDTASIVVTTTSCSITLNGSAGPGFVANTVENIGTTYSHEAYQCQGSTLTITGEHKSVSSTTSNGTIYDEDGNPVGGYGGTSFTCSTCGATWGDSGGSVDNDYEGDLYDKDGNLMGSISSGTTGSQYAAKEYFDEWGNKVSGLGAICGFTSGSSGDATVKSACMTYTYSVCPTHNYRGTHYVCNQHDYFSTSDDTCAYSSSGADKYELSGINYSGNSLQTFAGRITLSSSDGSTAGYANYINAVEGTNITVTLTQKPSKYKYSIVTESGTVLASGTDTANTLSFTMPKDNVTVSVQTAQVNPTNSVASSISKTYGDAAVSIGFTTNSNGAVSYTSSDTSVVAVNSAGTLTFKKVGSASITIKTAATDSYNASTTTVNVTVAKRPVTIQIVNASRVYNTNNPSFTYNITSGSLASGDTNSALGVTLSCAATKTSKVGTYAITGSYSSDNYAVTIKQGTLTVTKATPTVVTAPTASAITYGQKLANSNINGAMNTTGSFKWTDSTIAPTVADSNKTAYAVTFVPSDATNYNNVTNLSAKLAVNKATPTVVTAPSASGIAYGQTLGNSNISGAMSVRGSFAWTNAGTKPAVSDSNKTAYAITFTPTDTANYNVVTSLSSKLTVVKADASNAQIGTPSASTITYGQSLADSVLTQTGGATVPGRFTWRDSSIKPTVADSGRTAYSVTFTPTDTANYNSRNDITTTIIVNKATPVVTGTLVASDITYGDKLSASVFDIAGVSTSVAGSFVWKTPDLQPNATTGSDFDVVFVPNDSSNYNTVDLICTVVVHKAMPTVVTAPSASGIVYEQSLADSVLTGAMSVGGVFDWADNSIRPSVTDSNNTAYDVVFTPDDTANYNIINNLSAKLTVIKADATDIQIGIPSASDITYEQSLADSVLTQSDAATVTGTFTWQDSTIMPSVADSNNTAYRVVFIPDDTINYNFRDDIEIMLTVHKATPDITGELSASDITYGDELSNSMIDTSTITSSVTGDFVWRTPDQHPNATTGNNFDVVFIPDDTDNYNTVDLTCLVVVNKATPTVVTTPSASGITYEQTLSCSMIVGDMSVGGTFAWMDETIIPSVADSDVTYYDIIFTPADTDNYNVVSDLSATLTVIKADPTDVQIGVPTASDIIYGQTLADSNIVQSDDATVLGTFVWQDPTIMPLVADGNNTVYRIDFVPDDTVNYNPRTNIEIMLTVNKATPEITGELAASDITYKDMLSDSMFDTTNVVTSVDGNFVWRTPDLQPNATTGSDFDVVFIPDDTDNYNTVDLTCLVVVNKASIIMPADVADTISASDIIYEDTLAQSTIFCTSVIDIPGTFVWTDDSIVPTVADSEITPYSITYVPADTDNYNLYEGFTTTLIVHKKEYTTGEFTNIVATDITYGQMLGESTVTADASIDGYLVWVKPKHVPVATLGTAYDVVFIPYDIDNYVVVSGLQAEITVNKALYQPSTEEIASIKSTPIVYGNTLIQSKLSWDIEPKIAGKYVWTDETIVPEVRDSLVTKYDVSFVPEDTANYDVTTGMGTTVEVSKAVYIPSMTDMQTLIVSGIVYGQTLNDASITASFAEPGVFEWIDPTIKPTVADSDVTLYDMYFTAASGNYKPCLISQTVNVSKRVFTADDFEGLHATGIYYGQSLGQSVISCSGGAGSLCEGSFVWQDATIVPAVADSNKTKYLFDFIPVDVDNYVSLEGLSISIEVKSADPRLSTELIDSLRTSPITYGEALSASVITSDVLPVSSTDDTTPIPGHWEWVNGDTIYPAVADSNRTEYDIVFIPDDSDNIAPITGLKAVLQVNKADYVPTAEELATITVGSLIYEQLLGESVITGNFVVPGQFTWDTPNTKPTVADSDVTEYTIYFNDESGNYNPYSITKTVHVDKKSFDVSDFEGLSATGIYYGQSLDKSIITCTGGAAANCDGKFVWQNGDVVPTLADSGVTKFKFDFVPTDINNYETVEGMSLTVVVSVMNPQIPAELLDNLSATEIKYGESLSSSEIISSILPVSPVDPTISIPGHWEWVNGDTIYPAVADSNRTEYDIVFIPDESDRYEGITGIKLPITIGKADYILSDSELASIKASAITYGDTLAKSDITGVIGIAGHFTWDAPDTKPELADSDKTLFGMTYVSDDPNYNDITGLTSTVIVNRKQLSSGGGGGVKPVISTVPEFNVLATPIYVGQSLADSILTADESIDGTLTWVSPSTKPLFGDSDVTEYAVIYKPAGESSVSYTMKTTITVLKNVPNLIPEGCEVDEQGRVVIRKTYGDPDFALTVHVENADDITFTYTEDASNDTISMNEKGIVHIRNAGEEEIVIDFAGNDYWEAATLIVHVIVAKQTPVIPQDIIVSISTTPITYGDTLGESTITVDGLEIDGYFEWENTGIVPELADSNTTEYTLVFHPNDYRNYSTIRMFSATVQVNEAEHTIPVLPSDDPEESIPVEDEPVAMPSTSEAPNQFDEESEGEEDNSSMSADKNPYTGDEASKTPIIFGFMALGAMLASIFAGKRKKSR